eukprot:2354115-Lingulodinium_polyedra.AAC.1
MCRSCGAAALQALEDPTNVKRGAIFLCSPSEMVHLVCLMGFILASASSGRSDEALTRTLIP